MTVPTMGSDTIAPGSAETPGMKAAAENQVITAPAVNGSRPKIQAWATTARRP